MSLYRNRSGGSLYRDRSLTGFIKYLNKGDFLDTPDYPVGEISNSMMFRFIVMPTKREQNALGMKFEVVEELSV